MSYQKRIWILVALSLLLLLVLIKRKWIPSVERWSENKTLIAEKEYGIDPAQALVILRDENAELDKLIDRSAKNSLWSEALDLLSNNQLSPITLEHIDEEHVIEQDGYRISTLPITVRGSSEEVLTLIRAFENELPSVRVHSVRFLAKKASHRRKRSLYSTLILRSISS